MPKTPDMTQDEMVEILKGIIRDGTNAAARIAAIKELRAIQGGKRAPATGFEALDGPKQRLKAV
jgi:hypothetical protein